ncbi:unnamed protein product [Onchocerca ochengi]|uniref:DUF1758 domain-containing protein n=1 Tax=Onchocerca ochengi TaxID=42157 RepID=A0A182ENQ5_ONCOC|nr:unnamed protein product [Onchocerca ochengi]
MIEIIERVLRQLEALGENSEHSGIENLIETRMPNWIINKVYQQKEEQQRIQIKVSLTSFYTTLEEKHLPWSQSSSLVQKIKERVPIQKMHNLETRETLYPLHKKYWDADCQENPTLKQRLERVGVTKACLNCLRKRHETKDCNKIERKCFYCKGPYNSALCHTKYDAQDAGPTYQKGNPTSTNSMTQGSNLGAKEVLLLCKEITVSNPKTPEIQEKALALFYSGSQLSLVSKDLAKDLQGNEDEIRIASFGNKNRRRVSQSNLTPMTMKRRSFQRKHLQTKRKIPSLLAVERSKGQVGIKTLIKRLQADERLLQQYDKTIQDQLHSEIIEELQPEHGLSRYDSLFASPRGYSSTQIYNKTQNRP